MPVRVSTLPGLHILSGDAEVTVLAGRRVPLALLAYLAIERHASREALLALLWPEREEERARHSLSQALHELRRALGDESLQVTADTVAVDAAVETDLARLERAVNAGRWLEALDLYGGAFLDGVSLAPTHAFEEWVDRRRAQGERLHRKARREAVAERLGAGDVEGALVVAERWAELEELEDEAQQRTMELLARLGRRAQALEHYERFRNRLRAEELEPMPEMAALAAAIAAGGPVGSIGSAEPERRPAAAAGAAEMPVRTPPTPPQSPPPFARPQPALRRIRDLLGPLAARAAAAGPARRRWMAAALLLIALGGSGAWLVRRAVNARHPRRDPGLMVVLPFRVAGADPAVHYLREGMVDLLATKLNASGGSGHVLDPRTLMSAWRRAVRSESADLPPDSALELADRLGAGSLVLGEVVSAPGRIVLGASVRGPNGRTSPPFSVEGPADSLLALVDRLAAGILSAGAGQEPERLAYLTTQLLPALRAYLNGQALYRRGNSDSAVAEYRRALDMDSTFALAALGLHQAVMWGVSQESDPRALRLAWAGRERLGPRDRAMLLALAGPNYPEPSTFAEQLARLRALVELTPDRAEAWLELGDRLLHVGPQIDIADATEQARVAFRHALKLDPNLAFAHMHLAEIAILLHDTTDFKRQSALLLAQEPGARYTVSPVLFAAMRGDARAVATLRVAIDTGGATLAARVVRMAGMGTIDPGLGEVAARRAAVAPASPAERAFVYDMLYIYSLNRGHPTEALRWHDSLRLAVQLAPRGGAYFLIEDAVFWDGSTAAASAAAVELERTSPDSLGAREVLAVGLWRLQHGNRRGAHDALLLLQKDPSRWSRGSRIQAPIAAQVLAALLAATDRAPDAVARLDSVLRSGPPVGYGLICQANLTLAALRMRVRDAPGALRALQRTQYGTVFGSYLYSTFLREQARAARAAGQRDVAARAAAQYLRLRSDPEPSLRPEVEAFRREFADIVAEGPSRRVPGEHRP